jgi:ubiquinone/menaquinone biosynthesis C-methylase UbiE
VKPLELVHDRWIESRRAQVLAAHLAARIPTGADVLDVGCGSGELAQRIMGLRPDLRFSGTDVVVREHTHIPVTGFDGRALPQPDASVEIVLLSDVLHHADDPFGLLAEAARVARAGVVLKDVRLSDRFADATLTFMDNVANKRYDVPLPFTFWTADEWSDAFARLELRPVEWQDRLGLYPWPFPLLFERAMHFVTRLER